MKDQPIKNGEYDNDSRKKEANLAGDGVADRS
jgi:hypothetical protein